MCGATLNCAKFLSPTEVKPARTEIKMFSSLLLRSDLHVFIPFSFHTLNLEIFWAFLFSEHKHCGVSSSQRLREGKREKGKKKRNIRQLWSHHIHLHQSGFMDAIMKLYSCEWFWRPSDARGAITRQHLLLIYGQKLSNVCSGCENVRPGIMIRQGGHKLTDTDSTQPARNALTLTYWMSETQTLMKMKLFFFLKKTFYVSFITCTISSLQITLHLDSTVKTIKRQQQICSQRSYFPVVHPSIVQLWQSKPKKKKKKQRGFHLHLWNKLA